MPMTSDRRQRVRRRRRLDDRPGRLQQPLLPRAQPVAQRGFGYFERSSNRFSMGPSWPNFRVRQILEFAKILV